LSCVQKTGAKVIRLFGMSKENDEKSLLRAFFMRWLAIYNE
jgi:hypothetical protein